LPLTEPIPANFNDEFARFRPTVRWSPGCGDLTPLSGRSPRGIRGRPAKSGWTRRWGALSAET